MEGTVGGGEKKTFFLGEKGVRENGGKERKKGMKKRE